jgi:class 3 adenylate cyclase
MKQKQPARVGRRLAAIVAADVAGYSRLMGLDEVGTARTLREHRKVTDALVAKHGGRLVKTTGDGVLLESPSVVDAVECAVAVQAAMAQRNEGIPQDRRMLFRIGINLGDILIEGDDILGDGVNVAARLEGIAEPGGICVSSSAYDQVRGKVPVDFTDLGEQTLKNIDRPVRVYAAKSREQLGMVAPGVLPSRPEVQQPLPLPDKPSIAVLPFQNMSGDPEQEYFSDGMVEDIITALSRFKSLFVIARNSSFTYKGKAVDVKQVGRELGVRQAILLDPNFAVAYGVATACYSWAYQEGWMKKNDVGQISEGKRYALRAVELGDDALALSRAAHFFGFVLKDGGIADAIADQALAVNPNFSEAWRIRGWVSVFVGRHEPAIEQLHYAMRLNPLDYTAECGVAAANFFLRRFEIALSWGTKSLARQKNYAPAVRVAMVSYAMLGRIADAQMMQARMREAGTAMTISQLKEFLPFQRHEDVELWIEACRIAGVPE